MVIIYAKASEPLVILMLYPVNNSATRSKSLDPCLLFSGDRENTNKRNSKVLTIYHYYSIYNEAKKFYKSHRKLEIGNLKNLEKKRNPLEDLKDLKTNLY